MSNVSYYNYYYYHHHEILLYTVYKMKKLKVLHPLFCRRIILLNFGNKQLKRRIYLRLELTAHEEKLRSDVKGSKAIKIHILASGRVLLSQEDKTLPERVRDRQNGSRQAQSQPSQDFQEKKLLQIFYSNAPTMSYLGLPHFRLEKCIISTGQGANVWYCHHATLANSDQRSTELRGSQLEIGPDEQQKQRHMGYVATAAVPAVTCLYFNLN